MNFTEISPQFRYAPSKIQAACGPEIFKKCRFRGH